MKCEEFQKNILSEPNGEDDVAIQHKASCHDCARFADDLSLFDDQLRDALQVNVPASLKDELVPPQITRRSRRGIRAVSYAVAATVLFLVGVAGFINLNQITPLDRLIVSHIEHEPYILTKDMNPPDSEVEATLASMGVDMQGPVGDVTFIKKCYIGDELIAHLVVKGEKGPVSILVMPNQAITEQQFIEGAQLVGTVTPLSDSASLAVVGFVGEPLEPLRLKAQNAFKAN